MKNLFLGLVCLILLSACRGKEREIPIGWGTSTPRQYYLSGVICADDLLLKPSEVSVVGNEFSSGGPTMRGQLFEFYAVGDLYRDGHRYADFKRLADSFGDGNYYAPAGSSIHGGAYRHTLSSGIRSMSLTALSSYNATYPQGSDLSPITQLYSVQLQKQANRKLYTGELERIQGEYGLGVRPPFDDFLKLERISTLDQWQDIALPTGAGYINHDNEDRGRLLLGLVRFTEPATARQVQLRLTLTLMDGRELTREATLSLGN